MNNPFSLSFGKEPESMINRNSQNDEIIESFLSKNPAYQVCILTGVRGSGKTVELTCLSNVFRKNKDWIVIDLNPERDLLLALAAELSHHKECIQIFKDAKINVSVFGFSIEVDGQPPITDVCIALDRMIQKLTQKGKKVLIAIDEIYTNKEMKQFANEFQIWMRRNYNVFLIMSGLYENVYDLQNEKSLTFLYRAPKIEMKPLNINLVASNYQKIFNLDYKQSFEMAKVVNGYPFAYQVLGYLCFRNQTNWKNVLPEFDMYLEEYVYEKIWSELSQKDKDILYAMTHSNSLKVEDIRKEIDMKSNDFTVYRKRLMKKGVLRSPSYGYLEFSLPRFKEYVARSRW